MDSEQTNVYIPDANVGWVEAILTKSNETNETTVDVVIQADPEEEEIDSHPEDGTIRTVKKSTIFLQNKIMDSKGCDDMVNLNYLHEPAILFNLKYRFLKSMPYTYTGPICIAVNPYAWLDLYTKELQEEYLLKERSELPPHIYATSAAAYQHMRTFGENQSILVSGESGAGKTETTKILMSHLAAAGSSAFDETSSVNENETAIIDKVLQANPLMESFGNAKTSRNDNSSRFGKFSELQYDSMGQLIGAKSRTYLLEKSRVSIQGQLERNYHIFYQLLSAPEAITNQVKLHHMSTVDFPFLHTGDSAESKSPTNLKDAPRFQETLACLTTLGVSKADQLSIFQVVSAILHLSRLQFDIVDGNDDVSCLKKEDKNLETQAIVSDLLQLQSEELAIALSQRQMSAGSETYSVPLNVVQAKNTRTALAVALYSKLFDWLTQRVNFSTSANHSQVANKICILDIFGFEIFEKNSFEQLCINYANEKLQQKFTQDVFKSIQLEYEEEGIPWTKIEFADNMNVLSLIEGRFGVLSLLNEECMRPKGSDAAFANKLKAHYSDNDRFECPRFARDAFVVKHYAGAVLYDTNGFLLKNTDALQNDLIVLLKKTQSNFIKTLFPLEEANSQEAQNNDRRSALRRRTSIVADTVGTQFKSSLNGLMEDIRATNVHYIRCLKPNGVKRPDVFAKRRVTEQLQCAGVVEAVRISRCAFPNRMLQSVFFERFRGVAASKSQSVSNIHANVSMAVGTEGEDLQNKVRELLSKSLLVGQESQYQIGKTRVFFRKGALETLEEMRSTMVNVAAIVVQRYAKMWLAMAKYQGMKHASILVATMWRGYKQRTTYKKMKVSVVKLQSSVRRYQCQQLLAAKRRTFAATRIQKQFKQFVIRRKYLKQMQAIVKIQCAIRMKLAKAAVAVVRARAKEDAKLENQIQLLKQRLKEEKEARRELERERGMSTGSPRSYQPSHRSSMQMRSEDALDMSNSVIDQLREENASLKEANASLKTYGHQMRKEKEAMERGAYVNSASFQAANQRALKLQDEVDALKASHLRIKDTHRLLKTQNLTAMENVNALQNNLATAMQERIALRHQMDHYKKIAEKLQSENEAMSKANARLRLILRQDPELSRKHRDEVPKLTKLALSAKQTIAPSKGGVAPMNLPYGLGGMNGNGVVHGGTKVVNNRTIANKIVDHMSAGQSTSSPLHAKSNGVLGVSSTTDRLSVSSASGLGLSMTTGLASIGIGSAEAKAKTQRVVNIRERTPSNPEEPSSSIVSSSASEPAFQSSLGNKLVMQDPNTSQPPGANEQRKSETSTGIRQPTGEDGPIYGLRMSETSNDSSQQLTNGEDDESTRVSFSVTLDIDPIEDDPVKHHHASNTNQPVLSRRLSNGKREGGRSRRGSNASSESGDPLRNSSLRAAVGDNNNRNGGNRRNRSPSLKSRNNYQPNGNTTHGQTQNGGKKRIEL